MTTNDLIKDLDAALSSDRPTTDFEQQHPDAPEWGVELAERVEAARERLDRKEQAQGRKTALKTELERSVESIATRVERLADAGRRDSGLN